MGLAKIRDWLAARRRPRFPRATPEQLESVLSRRFAFVDRERFAELWSAIANICGVDPLLLNEDDEIQVLCRSKGALDLNLRIMELEALVMAESKHLPPPAHRPQRIGDIVDYLLENASK